VLSSSPRFGRHISKRTERERERREEEERRKKEEDEKRLVEERQRRRWDRCCLLTVMFNWHTVKGQNVFHRTKSPFCKFP